MLREDRPEEAAARAGGSELAIRYSSKRSKVKAKRVVIFIRRGLPAITSAEVEMMHRHLEESVRSASDAAQNDNQQEQ
jgi:hypothetical protein